MEQAQNLVVKMQQHGAAELGQVMGGPSHQQQQQQKQPMTIHATSGPAGAKSHPVVIQQQQHPGVTGQPQLIMQGNKIIAQGLAGYQAVLQQPQSVTTANIVKVPQPVQSGPGHVIQIPQPPQQQQQHVVTSKGPIPQPLNIPSTAKVEYITATAAGGQQIAKVQVPIQMPSQGVKVQMGHSMQQQQQIQVIQQQSLIQQQALAKHHLQQAQAQQQQQQGQGQGVGQQQQQPPPHMLPANKGLHQAPQILTGAVASPPLKQPHLSSQQPIVTGKWRILLYLLRKWGSILSLFLIIRFFSNLQAPAVLGSRFHTSARRVRPGICCKLDCQCRRSRRIW